MQVPDLALVRFVVEDHDHRAKNDFVGQFTLPFTSLRTGACTQKHTFISSGITLPIVAYDILIITIFLFRVSTCSFIEGRWLQSVPCNAFHPCQSDPQRSSHQERVRAHCNGQRKKAWRASENSRILRHKKGPLEKLRSEERKSLLPPAASPVQNSSGPFLHRDPLTNAVWGGSMPFTRYEAACWLLANECGRIMNSDSLCESLTQSAL